MQDPISKYLVLLSCLTIYVIKSCTYSVNCDPRCLNGYCTQLYSPYHCCHGCQPYLVNYYRELLIDTTTWAETVTNRCSEFCPPYQYEDSTSSVYTCKKCDRNCTTCSGLANTQCKTCAPTSYQLNATACYYMPPKTYCSLTVWNPCPDGFYGIQNTLRCERCPTGTTRCFIALQQFMPGANYLTTKIMDGQSCALDPLCTYTLRSCSCNAAMGFFLEQGFCFKDVCRKYQLYNSTSATFDPSLCYCMQGYFPAGSTCGRCDFRCKTCSSSASNGCTSCPTGWNLASGVCSRDAVLTVQKQNWINNTMPLTVVGGTNGTNGNFSITPGITSNTSTCGSFTWMFGLSTYNVVFPNAGSSTGSITANFQSPKLTYTSTTFTNGLHYAIHFRATFLFIDQWKSTMSIFFRQSSRDIYAYNYLMEEVRGEYLCGLNYHDHIAVVDFWFPHNTSNVNLEISSSSEKNPWGIRDVLIEELLCDPTCSTCSGPSAADCTQCHSSRNQVLVDGDCVCNIASGWYLDGTTCTQTCPTDKFKDNTTRSCVIECAFPTKFHYDGACYEKCPIAAPYRRWTDHYCVTECFNTSVINDNLNNYKYDGPDKACYNICPTGMYGDPESKSCVSKCPATSTEPNYILYGSFADGKFCKQVCTASKYAFTGTRQCLTSCPAGFYINTKVLAAGTENLCEETCSVTLGGSKLFGDNTTTPFSCTDLCPIDTYADLATHMCLGNCNNTAFKQSVIVGSDTVRTCRLNCESLTYHLFGNRVTHHCVQISGCPNNTYADYQSTFCEIACTGATYYGNIFTNLSRICATTCTTGFKQRDLKVCVKTCPQNNSAGAQEFGDSVSGFCEIACTGGASWYADNQTNRQCTQTCAASPMQSYGLNGQCVFNCSSTTWADPFHVNRICTTSCTYSAGGTKSYGYNYTRKCVSTCPDTHFGQVIATIPLCVYVCQNNEFGYPPTNLCVPNCPAPYYGDPTGNRSCVLECLQNGYYALNLSAEGIPDLANRTCVEVCPYGWADNITRMCAMSPFDCSQGLYAHQTNHKCVFPNDCTGFADPVSRKCVPQCYFNDAQFVRYFGDRDRHLCVLICPNDPDYFGDNSTKQCQTTCTNVNQVKDPQNNRRCVTNTNCSRLPVALFGDIAAGTCVIARNCTDGTFGDNNTMKCEADCQGTTTLLYADPISKECVNVCQPRYYSLNRTTDIGVCSLTCPFPRWADNITKRCQLQCSPNTYGAKWTDTVNTSYLYGTCQKQCPLNQFARDIDNLCVSSCGPGHWGQTVSRKCLTDPKLCPQGYYGDNQTHMCVVSTDCSLVGFIQYVADNGTKQCVSSCPPLTTVFVNWADMAKKLCVAKCPYNKFGDNTTLTCKDSCDNTNTVDGTRQYADFQLRICVKICSAYPIPTYGQNSTWTCVEARHCPPNQYAEDFYYKRVCISYCPDPRVNNTYDYMFADTVTKKCVFQCPTRYYGNIIAESNYGVCVEICPPFANGTLKFADNFTKRCVKECPESPEPQATFGDQVSLRCVKVCPKDWYAQRFHRTLPKRYCVQTCDLDTWSEDVKRTCVQTPFDCPTMNGYHWYALNSSTKCVETCPETLDLWGQNTTYTCQPSCESGTFKYNVTRVCIDLCPGSPDDDGSFSDQGMCYGTCITMGYYRDPQNSRSCQPGCSFSPVKYYADDTTMRCVLKCPSFPQMYYAYDTDRVCRLDCPSTTMRDSKTLKCVSSCPTGTFFDEMSDSCVSKCPSDFSTGKIWYGDSTQVIPKCVQALSCPSTYFADDFVQLCVQTCSENQFKYNKFCVTFCPDGYYGNKATGFCVLPSGCQNDHYAEKSSRLCVSVCNGTFADTNNKVCLDICPNSYFADSATRLCSTDCTNNATISLKKNLDNKTCVSNCAEELFLNPLNNVCESSCNDPYYENPNTQICVDICPSVPPLYGQNDTNKCVQECSNLTNEFKWEQGRVCVTFCPNGLLKNNFTRFCVKQCYNNSFADTQYCVSNCTPKYSLEDPNICTSSCPSPYFKDPTTFKCVLQCPTHPRQYYKVITQTDRRCDVNCPSGQFRDDLTYSCVDLCPPSPPTYADSTSGNCTAVCSNSFYAHKSTRTCVNKCPGSMFADPLSRTCVDKCQNGTDTYGDSRLAIPQCVSLCSPTTFANPYTLTCESACGSSPKTYGFDNNIHRICLKSCPYPYIANNYTHICQIQCLSTQYPYLDKASQQCVAECTSPMYQYAFLPTGQTINGTCVKFCPPNFFAYLANNTCVAKCPNGFYGQTTNQTCYPNCTLSNNKFADNAINMCVDTCIKYNNSYDSFADLYSRQCVTQCPDDKFTIKDTNTRRCEPKCTRANEYADWTTGYCVTMCPPGLYADPVTLTCVQNCSLYSQRYIYEVNRSCVSNCKDVGLYQNQFTRTCVDPFGCPEGYWGLNSTGVCVDVCPTTPDLFGDIVTKTCVLTCQNQTTGSQNFYADFSTRQCVKACPQIPALFALNDTRRCVSECPDNTYADNYTRRCVSQCSLIPGATYADNSTNRCVTTCPTQPNYFASNRTYECVLLCPSTVPKMYADYSTRKCVQNCPGGDIDTYADDSIRFCVRKCPGNTYMENTTMTCESICKSGFADSNSKFCIEVCPPFTYGHVGAGGNKTCRPQCPAQNPAIYAQDGNNLCMTECLVEYNTYRDTTARRCVKICPINGSMFADNVSRICRGQCPSNYYADYSTRYCVSQCPSVPALFAILDIRVCTDQCPANSWADNKTRHCILNKCPSTPDTYADNSTWTCVSECPTKPMRWADSSTRFCVPLCPTDPDFYADNFTRRCVQNCSQQTFADSTTRRCVQTCPQTWFGVNSTGRCERTCPDGQFADDLLNLCVRKCSVDPIFYGNPDTHICVAQCPAVSHSFGNPQSQQCVKYQSDGFSGCPEPLFAQNYTRLCVQVCPFKINQTRIDTYGDNSTWKCVRVCPAGSEDTYADNSTMRCVKTCPSYPEYYAEQYSRRCVSLCLQANDTYSGSFSNNITRKCVERCPQSPDYFSDNSTRRCVFFCPKSPLTFADYSTRRCVTTCPSQPYDIYGDFSTGRCVDKCPEEEQTYADYSTRLCVKVCPSNPSLYGQNQTNKCVPQCPNNSFADAASRLCVAVCPEYPDTYGDPSSNTCVERCPADPDLYADPLTQTCVIRCPPGYYAENDTRKCLPDCPQTKINYADNKTNRCVFRCPDSPLAFATYGDNSTRDCVVRCPLVPLTYADNITRICLKICNNVTNGGFAQNQTRMCAIKCPDGSFGDITTRYCVRYCPKAWYAYTVTNMCVRQCPTPFYSDPTTQRCVQVCPVSQLLFGEPFGRTCTAICPQTTYSAFNTQTCVAQCPSKQQSHLAYDTFGFNDTNECLDECPVPLYGWPVTYVCVAICPDPYYENITDHRCYKCPDECASCNYPQMCLTCNNNFFLYAGACVQTCPTFPVITYANPNRQCGTSYECTPGYFALNVTKSCVNVCPEGYYKNNLEQTCDPCQRGCSTCTNSSYCIICNNDVAIWYQFECYTYCSPLRKYYTETGCVESCPAGTFLNLTNCQVCSSVCRTCAVQPQNCITCAGGLYLSNNLCVETCPFNTKATNENGSLMCRSCDIVNCTTQPLTYEVSQFVDNFQFKFQLKFSQPVDIEGEIAKIISIKKRTRRRLRMLQTVLQFLDYTIIDYGDGTYEFILNDYDPSEGDNQFEFQILNPELIKSPSGQLPSTTRATIEIDLTTSYSIKDYNKSFTFYNTFIIFVAMILLIFTFWTDYSVWAPMFDYMQIMMALFLLNVILPPTPMYALGTFKYALFTFLPNFFVDLLPTAQFNPKIMNSSIYSVLEDFIFLRNMGQMYFILIALVLFYLIIFAMSKKFFNKAVKSWSKNFIKEQFTKKYLFGIVNILFLPVFLMGLISIKSYSQSSTIVGFSAFSSWLFIVLLFIPICYCIYKLRKLSTESPITYLTLQKAYNFIAFQKIVMINNEKNFFTYEKNEIDLTKGREPRINQIRILPFDLQTRMGPTEICAPLVGILHKLLVAVFIIAAYENVIVQIFFIMVINLLFAIYLLLKKPYIRIGWKQFTSEMIIHNMAVITLTLVLILIFKVQMSSMSSQSRNSFGLGICLSIVYGLTSNIIYFAYRTYNFYFDNIWRKFVESDLFKQNYTLEHFELVKKYSQKQELLKKQLRSRNQLLQTIKVQKGEALAGMVLRDPNQTTAKEEYRDIKLRPNKNQIIKQDITDMFRTMHNQHEKSHKSARSSERLSKIERQKVRKQIFENIEAIKEEEYERVKIDEKSSDEIGSQTSDHKGMIRRKNQLKIQGPLRDQNRSESYEEEEFQFQYIEEEYPEDTPIEEIMKGCKKGDVIMP